MFAILGQFECVTEGVRLCILYVIVEYFLWSFVVITHHEVNFL